MSNRASDQLEILLALLSDPEVIDNAWRAAAREWVIHKTWPEIRKAAINYAVAVAGDDNDSGVDEWTIEPIAEKTAIQKTERLLDSIERALT